MQPDIAFWATVVTICGTILTGVHALFVSWMEHKRYARMLALEERRAQLEERRLAVELYNQQRLKIFSARLASYASVFEAIMPLDRYMVNELTPEGALEIESRLRDAVYIKTSNCMSTESMERATILRDALVKFSKGELDVGALRDIRRDLLRSLHRDLGRTGAYLGDLSVLIDDDAKRIQSLLKAEE